MKIFKGQHWHFIMLSIFLMSVFVLVKNDNSILTGEIMGVETMNWFLLALSSPIFHQVYVLLIWRLELFYNSISKKFGVDGFKYYKIGFALLFFSRLLTIIILAISNSNTLNLNEFLAYLIAGIIFIPSLYLFYSVKKYFGIDRAFGIDHFYPNKFKNVPFVKKGIFKYSSNAMYKFGFLILWIPGLLMLSKAAILAALFNHIYIWVHYYFTELPDIKIIYEE